MSFIVPALSHGSVKTTTVPVAGKASLTFDSVRNSQDAGVNRFKFPLCNKSSLGPATLIVSVAPNLYNCVFSLPGNELFVKHSLFGED